MRRNRPPARQELGGHRALEPEEVLRLTREDDQGDPAREPDGDGVRDELDRPAQPREAEAHEDDARHEGRHGETLHPVSLHDGVHDHDKRAGRPADLHARAAQCGDDKSRDDRGEQPALRAHSARNRKGDGERERHDPDDDPRAQIREKLFAGVARERGDELGYEPVQIPRPASDAENLTKPVAVTGQGRPGGPASTGRGPWRPPRARRR